MLHFHLPYNQQQFSKQIRCRSQLCSSWIDARTRHGRNEMARQLHRVHNSTHSRHCPFALNGVCPRLAPLNARSHHVHAVKRPLLSARPAVPRFSVDRCVLAWLSALAPGPPALPCSIRLSKWSAHCAAPLFCCLCRSSVESPSPRLAWPGAAGSLLLVDVVSLVRPLALVEPGASRRRRAEVAVHARRRTSADQQEEEEPPPGEGTTCRTDTQPHEQPNQWST